MRPPPSGFEASIFDFARTALLAVRAKRPARGPLSYPAVLLFQEHVEVEAVADHAPELAKIVTVRPRQLFEAGTCYLGPLDVCPAHVAVIIWAGAGIRAWLFDPQRGDLIPSQRLADQARLPA